MNTVDSWDREVSSSELPKLNVPWLHIHELQQVAEDMYSPNLECQRRGYEKLLMWKARVPKLPAGVECAVELLHVHILNQEISLQLSRGGKSTYLESDLQLMISSAVMRCVNHISDVTLGYSESLRTLSEKFNIPKWIIKLRNDAAHKSSLPSLAELQMGIKFSMEWLLENYWKNSIKFHSWVISKSKPLIQNKYLKQLLDVWQALKIYELNRYEHLSSIPQENLRNFVKQLLTDNKGYSKDSHFHMCSVVNGICMELLKEIQPYCLNVGTSRLETLLAVLISCEAFIPPLSIITFGELKKKELNNSQILKWLSSFWSSVLSPLQAQYSLFPMLIHKILLHLHGEKSFDRKLIMALWIKLLCISMIKSEAVLLKTREISGNVSDVFHKIDYVDRKKKSRKELSKKCRFVLNIEERVVKENPDLKEGFLSFPINAEGNFCSPKVLKLALAKPTKYTTLFIPSLLMVTKPCIPNHFIKKLEKLVSMFASTDIRIRDFCPRIHTVQELGVSEAEIDSYSNKDNKFWNMASEYEWSTCPLGLLPWQKETLATLDFPSNVTWTSPEDDDNFNPSEFNDFQFKKDLTLIDKSVLQRNIDWVRYKYKLNPKKSLIKRRKSNKKTGFLKPTAFQCDDK